MRFQHKIDGHYHVRQILRPMIEQDAFSLEEFVSFSTSVGPRGEKFCTLVLKLAPERDVTKLRVLLDTTRYLKVISINTKTVIIKTYFQTSNASDDTWLELKMVNSNRYMIIKIKLYMCININYVPKKSKYNEHSKYKILIKSSPSYFFLHSRNFYQKQKQK